MKESIINNDLLTLVDIDYGGTFKNKVTGLHWIKCKKSLQNEV